MNRPQVHRNGKVKRKAHFPSVRLAAAGFGSLLLLVWVTFVPGTSPMEQLPKERIFPLKILCTTLLALLVVTILGPVFWYGPWRDRLMAALATIFPLLVLGAMMLWFAARLF